MMAKWDDIYREIRRRNLSEGIAVAGPADTSLLHRGNVVTKLRRDHENARSFSVADEPAQPEASVA